MEASVEENFHGSDVLALNTLVNVAPRTGAKNVDKYGKGRITHYVPTEDGKVLYGVKFIVSKLKAVVEPKFVRTCTMHTVEDWWEKEMIAETQEGHESRSTKENYQPISQGVDAEEDDFEEDTVSSGTQNNIPVAVENKRINHFHVVESNDSDFVSDPPLPSPKPQLTRLTPTLRLSETVITECSSSGDEDDGNRTSSNDDEIRVVPQPKRQRSSGIDSENSAEEKEDGRSENMRDVTKPMSQSSTTIRTKEVVTKVQEAFDVTATLKSITLPAGVAGVVGQYLVEINRPVNIASIVQKFKELYTRSQLERALATLTEKNIIMTLDDGAKIYWINQDIVEKSTSMGQGDAARLDDWVNKTTELIASLERERTEAEGRVRALILAPSDEELEKQLTGERQTVEILQARVKECEQAVKEAEKQGKCAAEMLSNNVSELNSRLTFYRRCWRERKRITNDFVDKVCDSKGLKKSGKKDLIETMGLETDEDVGVILPKGNDV